MSRMAISRRSQVLLVLVAVVIATMCFTFSSSTALDFDARASSYSSLWQLGLLRTSRTGDDATELGSKFPGSSPEGYAALSMFATSKQLLHVVPRAPVYANLYRGRDLPRAPPGSVYVDRPPVGSLVDIPLSCLNTRAPALRSRTINTFTFEIVVLFLDSPHFGRAWQTVMGRNGGNFTDDSFLWQLSGMYIKLDPKSHILLELWVEQQGKPKYVTIKAGFTASPNTWYSIVAQNDGDEVKLYINGELQGMVSVIGSSLAVPPNLAHGDFTLGCGMFASVLTDPCSCLLSEARISERFIPPSFWLWTTPPTWIRAPKPNTTRHYDAS